MFLFYFYFIFKILLIKFKKFQQELKPKCRDALKRIFVLCDNDQDGLLNDLELNTFQQETFGAPLTKNELEELKVVILDHEPEGVKNNGVTVKGFHFYFLKTKTKNCKY